jgi:hypothetical protein
MLYRITAYNKEINISVIMDSTEKLKNLEDFERYMVQKGFKIIESGTDDTFLGGNLKPPINYPEYVILRACQYGEPQERKLNIDKRVLDCRCYDPQSIFVSKARRWS